MSSFFKLVRITILTAFTFLLLFPSGLSQVEVTLAPNTNIDFDVDCLEIEMGERVIFTRDGSCGPHLLISPDRGRTTLFASPKAVVPFVFEDPGEYTIFCNGTTDSALTALCINVVDPSVVDLNGNPIPTMGEWGVVCLFLMMMICCVVAVKDVQGQTLIA